MSLERYRMFAGYNAWANARLYDAAAALPEAEYRADRKAFFGSLHRTLNHVLVADLVWMKRFTGAGEPPADLGAVLHDDLAALREARDLEDARITAYVEGLDPAILEHAFEYRNMAGTLLVQPLSSALDHFFNHQTHHRGQAHALVSAAGASPPELDLVYYEREVGVCRTV